MLSTDMSQETKYYAAIDLGATSGRVVLSSICNGKIELEVINRFPNHLIKLLGHCYWDIYSLFNNILEGLSLIAKRNVNLESIGVDTWGVDIVLVGKDGMLLGAPYSYRDPHTGGASEKLFQRITPEEMYNITGLQVMDINTIFQLDTMKRNDSAALEVASHILFMPDAISYLLTGKMVTEYTIASTGAIVNAKQRKLDNRLLKLVGLDAEQFGVLVYPGTTIGHLSAEVQQITGLPAIKVIAVGSHDTASAVAAVPAHSREFAYLSSGTWSLMGIEVDDPIINEESRNHNFTNEGGVHGTIRFLKNICGMWLLERCRAEWEGVDYDTLISEAIDSAPFRSLINPDDELFANPQSMTKAIVQYCKDTNQATPSTRGEFTRCIFESLALRYRQVFDDLQSMAPFPLKVLHIIGGGSRNALLNQWTANAIGIPVIAGPTECTAMGNVMIQAGLSRENIASNIPTVSFVPENKDEWENAYKLFINTTEKLTSK